MIDDPNPPQSEIIKSTENGRINLSLNGGYITNWEVLNPKTGNFEKILYQGSTLKRTGIPILFPQFSNGDPLPSHGFGRNSTWKEVKKLSENTAAMGLSSENISPEMQSLYPYAFTAQIATTLNDGSLIYELSVNNQGEKDMPIAPGLHPYWGIPHSEKSGITTEGIPGFNGAQIDWDNNPPDDHYDFSGKASVHFPDGKTLIIEDLSDEKSIKYLQVWSQTPEKDDYNFVCFEPLTGLDNAINEEGKHIAVKPGETWKMKIKFSVIY